MQFRRMPQVTAGLVALCAGAAVVALVGAVAPAHGQGAAGLEGFESRRSYVLQSMDQEQRWLDQSKRCVQAARSPEALENCRRQAPAGGSGYGPMGGHMRGWGWGGGWGCPMW